MSEHLIETWRIHNRIHLYMLSAIPEELLGSVPAKGRTIGEQFHHVYKVRLLWLKTARSEALAAHTETAKEEAGNKNALIAALEASSALIEELIADGCETGRIKGFKPHPTAFAGYLISHESHHRGQIALYLKQANAPLDRKVSYGLWEWGVR